MEQILGISTGIIFGFLLQRGGLIRYEKQIGMLLFKDMTVLKFMLTAIAVGMIGVTILSHFDIIALSHRSMNVGGILIGGGLFGVGWALTGLCPGTSLGALGEGRIHALFTIAGMVVGGMLFSHSYDFLQGTVLSWLDFGRIGLSDVIGVPSLIIMPIFVIGVIFLMRFLEKKGIN
jgi:uncharacterized membrane protein YedE/YeeE